MKNIIIGVVLAVSVAANIFLGIKAKNDKDDNLTEAKVVKIVRVVDGDTAMTDDNKYWRLAGIDAPEYPEGCLGDEAKSKLEELILDKYVAIAKGELDHFGRTLGYGWIGDTSIEKVMLEEGLAKVDKPEKNYEPLLMEAEAEAKRLTRGVWGTKCQPKANCKIKGNYRQANNTKVYQLPECYNYAKTIVDEKKGDRWFCGESEAKAAGFKKSDDCPGRK